MMNTLKVMLAGMGLAALAGCSTYKIQSWSDPAISERPIGKVMVVGIAQSATTCRMFENHFVEQLQIQGIAAVSGHEDRKANPDTAKSDQLVLVKGFS